MHHNCLSYMTHASAFPERRGPCVWAVLLELTVDRQFGRTVHDPWCQKHGSTCVAGAMLHATNINDVMQQRWKGWYRIMHDTLKVLSNGKVRARYGELAWMIIDAAKQCLGQYSQCR